MAQAMVNFRMDAELKRAMEETFRQMGLTMADAFTVFAVKVMQEQRIPSILKQNRANLIPEIKKDAIRSKTSYSILSSCPFCPSSACVVPLPHHNGEG